MNINCLFSIMTGTLLLSIVDADDSFESSSNKQFTYFIICGVVFFVIFLVAGCGMFYVNQRALQAYGLPAMWGRGLHYPGAVGNLAQQRKYPPYQQQPYGFQNVPLQSMPDNPQQQQQQQPITTTSNLPKPPSESQNESSNSNLQYQSSFPTIPAVANSTTSIWLDDTVPLSAVQEKNTVFTISK